MVTGLPRQSPVNPNMPRTLGDSFLPVKRIARLVPVCDPLPELHVEGGAEGVAERGVLDLTTSRQGAQTPG